MDTAKTMDLTCLCLQINNTVVFFSNHTHIKLIKKFKAETMSTESPPSLWHNATFRVSQYRTKDIHCRTEQLSQFKREKERE